jgi:hypothetical protein
MSLFPALFLAKGSNTACSQTGRARPDQLCKAANELEFRLGWSDIEFFFEEFEGLVESFEGISVEFV